MPGEYKKPVWGAALFHQSSLNDLFGIRGLSATVGLRFDYEHSKIDYFTETQGVVMTVRPPGSPMIIDVLSDTTMQGDFKKDFFEILPKFALQYRPSETSFVYVSASKGYKSGGYNEQSFSQILRDAMQLAMMEKMIDRMPPGISIPMPPASGNQPTLEEMLSYDPERSWTYEIGGRKEMFDRRLSATFALFYSQVNNIQIIQLLDGGSAGRIITNAGQSTSKGVELGLRYAPNNNFSLFGEYGFADARFNRYETTGVDDEGKPITIDYSDNHIPFAPQHTLSVGANYVHRFANGAFIDRLIGNISYNGVGKIYWTESNSVYQPFYGITNASIAAEKGVFGLELWTKNLFNTQYNAFFVEVSDMAGNVNPIVQRGVPTRVGATLRVMF
jgi:outer membrane receptor protein involved in Fe transport